MRSASEVVVQTVKFSTITQWLQMPNVDELQEAENLIGRALTESETAVIESKIRWAQHWLDVVRYADSSGDNSDFPIPQIYRYRNWVIEAFNQDLPYDQFIREQIAGDLMSGGDIEAKARRQIATTYLLLGNFNYEDKDREQLRMDIVDEQIDTIGKTFLGLSFACARCHDHKSEPISQRDYYTLQAFFAPVNASRAGVLFNGAPGSAVCASSARCVCMSIRPGSTV